MSAHRAVLARVGDRSVPAIERHAGARKNVLHLVDTLEMGGAERVAVNLVNALPRDRFRFSLGTTRRDGPLADLVAGDVTRLRLQRSGRFDLSAIGKLVRFIRAEHIQLLHAHGTALFIARVAAQFAPYPAVVWHDHFGRYAVEERPLWLYRLATARIGGVITVNTPLAEWATQKLGVSADRVWYVPNFVWSDAEAMSSDQTTSAALPGTKETRIVCVANFRPQKDHHTLVAAMAGVVAAIPAAQLLLIGATPDARYLRSIRATIVERNLEGHITILGPRRDVPAILRAAAVGVLSSSSEGLPLALIEYGEAGLGVVTTDVGECKAVLDDGRAGVLVRAGATSQLTTALIELLSSPARRATLGARLQEHVRTVYGHKEGLRHICDVYDRVLDR